MTKPRNRGGIPQVSCQFYMDEPLAKELDAMALRHTPPLSRPQMIIKLCSEAVAYRRERYLPEEGEETEPEEEREDTPDSAETTHTALA